MAAATGLIFRLRAARGVWFSGVGQRLHATSAPPWPGARPRLFSAAPAPRDTLLPELSLRGRVIVVSGGGRGLGLVQAQACLEAGATVHVLDRLLEPPDDFVQVAAHARDALGAALTYHRVDVREDEAQLHDVVAGIADTHGRLDGLVAAAAIQHEAPSLEHSGADMDHLLQVNVTGTFLTAQAVARQMVRLAGGGRGGSGGSRVDGGKVFDAGSSPEASRTDARSAGGSSADTSSPGPNPGSGPGPGHGPGTPGTPGTGSIVLIASMSGTVTNRGLLCPAYNASKAAVLQLGRSLAAEWGVHGIRVNTLSPGYIVTAMTDFLFAAHPERRAQWSDANMLNRLSRPEEYRGAAVFLLSDASSFMTGSDLRMDGGHCAW